MENGTANVAVHISPNQYHFYDRNAPDHQLAPITTHVTYHHHLSSIDGRVPRLFAKTV
jgi:hypothetical protein